MRFQLTANGPGIEGRVISFEIPAGERFHHEEVDVKLRSGGTPGQAGGGIISAASLHIPENARNEFARGMQEMREHNWSKARAHFEKAITTYPQFDWAYNNIGVAYIQEKNTKGAREAFEKAVAINDKNPDAVRNLARMKLVENDFSGGKELLLKLGPTPHDPDALTLLAFAQMKTNDLEAALSNAVKVHQGDPDRFPMAHLIAGRIYEVEGNQSAAQAQYQMYLREAPDSPQAQIAKEGMQRLSVRK
jgi:Tfp pilus assembly protein PilF